VQLKGDTLELFPQLETGNLLQRYSISQHSSDGNRYSSYEFILFDIGTNGRILDGGVINNTSSSKAIVEDILKLPPFNNSSHLP
jgi:hypothetical protein